MHREGGGGTPGHGPSPLTSCFGLHHSRTGTPSLQMPSRQPPPLPSKETRTPSPPHMQRLELEQVKRERSALLESLAALRKDSGRTGGDFQVASVSHAVPMHCPCSAAGRGAQASLCACHRHLVRRAGHVPTHSHACAHLPLTNAGQRYSAAARGAV